ncbi:MAG: transcriptional regulator [Desulfobulbaceae bacterium]|nr:transcriptional regulator [Desulfobulbaceae bacterium]
MIADDDMQELTVRGRLRVLLSNGWHTLRELSQALHQSEKELISHLEHLRRSKGSDKAVFEVDAPICLQCGFHFSTRERLQQPGRCPQCRATRISKARYRLRPGA